MSVPSKVPHALSTPPKTVEELHGWLLDIATKVSVLPDMGDMLKASVSAQERMAASAQSMAETFRKTEERHARLEERYEELTQTAAGKDQIPLKSHYLTLAAALLPTFVMALGSVFGILYVTKYDLKASLTEIQLNQGKQQELLNETKKQVEEHK